MSKLDMSKPHGTIEGDVDFGRKFEQDGRYYDTEHNEVVVVDGKLVATKKSAAAKTEVTKPGDKSDAAKSVDEQLGKQ